MRPGARLTKTYNLIIQIYNKSHTKIKASKMHILRFMGSKFCVKFQRCPLKLHPKFWTHTLQNTVGTPYNTAPYITGSNIARLGHGSQNSWSKLWIPIVKSAPVRAIFTWKSVLKKSIRGSSDIYLGTLWKQRHDSPWSYRSDVIVSFLWYGTIGIIWHRDHQSTAKKV